MIENFNLYPLHVFRLVARHSSVTRAAQELCISQPAASSHIRALESQYGIPLFERTPQGMRLTPAGLSVSGSANRLFAELEGIGEAIKTTRGEVGGEIRVGASTIPGAYLLPPLIRSFKERYPKAEPILLIGDSAQVMGWLHDYSVPIAVMGGMLPLREDEQWAREPFTADVLRLVAAPNNSLCEIPAIRESHLRDQTLLLREQGSSTRAGAERLLDGSLGSFRRVLEITSAEAIKEAVIAGLGVAVLSSLATHREEASGLLRPVQDTRLHLKRPFYLTRRKDRPPIGVASALWQFLREEVETI